MTTTMRKTRRTGKTPKPTSAAGAVIQVRVDAGMKDRAEKFFRRHGMSTGDGVRLLLRRAMTEDALPHMPNAETQKAMDDCRAGAGEAVPHSELKNWILGKT